MFWRRTKEKELKMIWEVKKKNKKSHLVGTAHFFPFSFKTSLYRCIKDARTVIFEGPLDQKAMEQVVNCGFDHDNNEHLFDDLDRKTIDKITAKLAPRCRNKNLLFIVDLRKLRVENPVYEMVKGMKPWLAFFTIWSSYLKANGWKYSVDMEGYHVARELDKSIIYLETIEEQIKVLENLSKERIVYFLDQVDQWHELAHDYVDCYLCGDLQKLRSKGLRFPSRHQSVIDHRDEIFYERMQPYLMQGRALAFVGAPHVHGISKMLREDGYDIRRPRLPAAT